VVVVVRGANIVRTLLFFVDMATNFARDGITTNATA
jgi:hypothetical protein